MIWRIILFWLASVAFVLGDLPRHPSVDSVASCKSIFSPYDATGNLTNDGTRVFSYDAENQLTNVLVSNTWQVGFVYDGLNRRRVETDYTWSGTWVPTNVTRFLYDGMVVLQERKRAQTILLHNTR